MHFRIILIFFILIIPVQTVFSDKKTHSVFISSDPINCSIIIDNIKLKQKTPLLLKEIETGAHSIEIIKKGYLSKIEKITLNKENNNIYSYIMIPENQLFLYGSQKVKDYPKQRLIDSLNIVIPVLGCFSAALTYNELSNPRYSSSLLSPFVISTYAVNTLFISTDIALHINKNSFLKNKQKNSNEHYEKDLSEIIFNSANNAFQKGDFEEAFNDYMKIIDKHKDSPLFARSLYKSAVIEMINNNYKKASDKFYKIVNDYPEAGLYDKSLKNLAEILIIKKEYKKAVLLLKDMQYVNSLYNADEIQTRIDEIAELSNNTN